MRAGWVEVVCPDHGFIAEVPESADCYCRLCDRWIRLVPQRRKVAA